MYEVVLYKLYKRDKPYHKNIGENKTSFQAPFPKDRPDTTDTTG